MPESHTVTQSLSELLSWGTSDGINTHANPLQDHCEVSVSSESFAKNPNSQDIISSFPKACVLNHNS